MRRSFKALLTAVLFAAPILVSCNEAQGPIAPATNIESQAGLIGDLLETTVDIAGSLLGPVLTGPDANGKAVSAWIGSEGGTIKTAAYTLTVPRGAVSKRTKFEVAPTNTSTYSLDLHAYEQGLLGLIDVGSKGFKKPVSLTISFANANNVKDVKNIAIIYIASPTQVELQQSIVDVAGQTVTSPLSHFSKYAMVQN